MTLINPELAPGQTLDQVNPDLAFSYELARKFQDRQVNLSLEENPITYTEVQIGYIKRPAWFPYVSIHTSDSPMTITHMGQGAGMRARQLSSEFGLIVRDESGDEQLGRARLTDLKWDVIQLLAGMAGGGETYRYLDIDRIEMVGITPEETTEPVPWAHSGQVLALGTVFFD